MASDLKKIVSEWYKEADEEVRPNVFGRYGEISVARWMGKREAYARILDLLDSQNAKCGCGHPPHIGLICGYLDIKFKEYDWGTNRCECEG